MISERRKARNYVLISKEPKEEHTGVPAGLSIKDVNAAGVLPLSLPLVMYEAIKTLKRKQLLKRKAKTSIDIKSCEILRVINGLK